MIFFIKLRNKFDTVVTLCNVGASIYDIETVDKNNKCESILYTTKDSESFVSERSYLGKTIGRTGGRISNSKFTLNGKEYTIPTSDPNGLHGGDGGISYVEYKFKQSETKEYHEVVFNYLSTSEESKYPGDLKIYVTYRLFKEINRLTVNYKATTTEDTLVNISNHSYFNLSGNAKNNILDHYLYINSSKMERVEDLIPREIVDCSEIYSFKKSHRIGDYLMDKEIINNTNGYDFPYIFDKQSIDICNIILKDKESGRVLKIETSYPTVVVYTCNYVGNEIMNNNKKMEPYYAVCLECMFHPNTINSDFLDNKLDILRKNNTYDETIEYYFEVENE